ncbi:hypothetical protein [Bradyrhizobium sp. BR 1432]|uniref:hypothetical protein n=1 Tax=Bradyrhizobium sp. BR 1432 TaxID=3447966 RepID=UPI003EE48186
MEKQPRLDPGCYTGSITVNAGAVLNPQSRHLLSGRASLSVAGNATITGSGVTLVFTGSGSNWGTASIGSNATVDLTAPTSGATKGIVMYGDRNMPAGTAFNLTGGSTQNFGGAIYLPKANLSFSGGNGTSIILHQNHRGDADVQRHVEPPGQLYRTRPPRR